MGSLEKRTFDSPDETRTPDKTTVELVKVGGTTVGRYTFQPGWRWSDCVKPVAKTDTCQVDHVGYVVQGRLHIARRLRQRLATRSTPPWARFGQIWRMKYLTSI